MIASRKEPILAIYLIAIKDECWVSLNDKETSGCVFHMSPYDPDYTPAFLHLTTTVIADVELVGIQHWTNKDQQMSSAPQASSTYPMKYSTTPHLSDDLQRWEWEYWTSLVRENCACKMTYSMCQH